MTTKKQITNAATLTTAYTYTAADRLASMTYPSGFVATYTRDSVGRISTVLWGSSIGTPMTLVSATGYYPFGPMNTLTFALCDSSEMDAGQASHGCHGSARVGRSILLAQRFWRYSREAGSA